MKCPKCNKEMKVVDISVNNTSNNEVVREKTLVCDDCKIKHSISENLTTKEKKKQSKVGIIATILSFVKYLYIVGMILAIVDLCKNDKTKKHFWSWFAIVISCFALIFNVFFFILSSDTSEDGYADNNNIQSQMENDAEQEDGLIEKETSNNKIEIQEQLIYDKNKVKISITGYEDDCVCFYIENNSDKNYDFNMHSFAINGIMTNNNIYEMDCPVASKSKSNCKLDISSYFSDQFGDVIDNFDFHIWAYDNETNMKDFDCGTIHIVTNNGNDNNNFVAGEPIHEQSGLLFQIIEINDKSLKVAITNTNKELVELDTSSVVVNGWTFDTSYCFDIQYLQVLPNCQNIYDIELDDEFLSNNNITEINDIVLQYDVTENYDFYNQYSTDKIEISK